MKSTIGDNKPADFNMWTSSSWEHEIIYTPRHEEFQVPFGSTESYPRASLSLSAVID